MKSPWGEDDHERPDQIELLFDCERPEMIDVVRKPPELREVEIAQVADVPRQALPDLRNAEQQQERERAVEQRENAQEPANVKPLEDRRCGPASGLHRLPGRPKDPGDQESAEDEEQLNADESKRQIEGCFGPEVMNHHREYSEASQRVQLRHVPRRVYKAFVLQSRCDVIIPATSLHPPHIFVIAPHIRDRPSPRSPTAARFCPGRCLAHGHGMAIMWDPPAERPSLEPTPAEVAWKRG